MLKWTARAFALAAALQLGNATAQDVGAESDVELVPPGRAELEQETEVEPPPALDASEDAPLAEPAQDDAAPDLAPLEDLSAQDVEDAREEARQDLRNARDAQRDLQEGAIERESRFRPEAAPPVADDLQIDDRVRAGTANLDIDDATRSRYRWHNGEWWFKTRSGSWKFHRDGAWHDFDPTTYQAASPGLLYDSGSYLPQTGYSDGFSGGYAMPRNYNNFDGYHFQRRPYTTTRYFGAYRPDYEAFDGRYYRGGYGGQVYGDGYYGRGYGYDRGYGYGYGDRGYYGRDGYGRVYDADRYRGGVIGAEIGGRLGGRTGAIIGGAIGADAAD